MQLRLAGPSARERILALSVNAVATTSRLQHGESSLMKPAIRRSSLSRSSCGLQMRPIEIQGGSEPFLVLCGEFGQQLHFGNSRAIERFDVRPVDLDQIPAGSRKYIWTQPSGSSLTGLRKALESSAPIAFAA